MAILSIDKHFLTYMPDIDKASSAADTLSIPVNGTKTILNDSFVMGKVLDLLKLSIKSPGNDFFVPITDEVIINFEPITESRQVTFFCEKNTQIENNSDTEILLRTIRVVKADFMTF